MNIPNQGHQQDQKTNINNRFFGLRTMGLAMNHPYKKKLSLHTETQWTINKSQNLFVFRPSKTVLKVIWILKVQNKSSNCSREVSLLN